MYYKLLCMTQEDLSLLLRRGDETDNRIIE
jgi:hypothetical protein